MKQEFSMTCGSLWWWNMFQEANLSCTEIKKVTDVIGTCDHCIDYHGQERVHRLTKQLFIDVQFLHLHQQCKRRNIIGFSRHSEMTMHFLRQTQFKSHILLFQIKINKLIQIIYQQKVTGEVLFTSVHVLTKLVLSSTVTFSSISPPGCTCSFLI